MLRRQISVLCLLLLAAVETSAAQAVVRPDTVRLGWGTRSGGWSATNGSTTFMGTWTATPDTIHGTVTGTWTLANAQGATVAYGGWAAAKSPARWAGSWRANVTGRAGEYTGTWTSTIDLEANARFVELFETAARTIVSGTWNTGARSGAWSIRAAKDAAALRLDPSHPSDPCPSCSDPTGSANPTPQRSTPRARSRAP